ncbi:MAG: hypothetical protein V2B18_21220 [Pseudomonadota bacterium]
MATDAEKLALYEAALVDSLTTGQRVEVDGRVYMPHDIEKLEKLIDYYRQRTNGASTNIFDRSKIGIPYRG